VCCRKKFPTLYLSDIYLKKIRIKVKEKGPRRVPLLLLIIQPRKLAAGLGIDTAKIEEPAGFLWLDTDFLSVEEDGRERPLGEIIPMEGNVIITMGNLSRMPSHHHVPILETYQMTNHLPVANCNGVEIG
jgi:hypothetical protein